MFARGLLGAILQFLQIYEYFPIYMHENGTDAAKSDTAVCVQFACISPSARAFWIARYFLFLICTDLAFAKAAQSFSELGP